MSPWTQTKRALDKNKVLEKELQAVKNEMAEALDEKKKRGWRRTETFVQAHAEIWWIAIRDGIMRDRDVLKEQALKLEGQQLEKVVDELNKGFEQLREDIQVCTPVGKCLRNALCWEFLITAEDLSDVLNGFTKVEPGWLAWGITKLWALLMKGELDRTAERLQIQLNVQQKIAGKLLRWNLQDACKDAYEWLEAACGIYLTLSGFYFWSWLHYTRHFGDLFFLHQAWKSWDDDNKKTCMMLLIWWLVSAYLNHVIQTWMRAMKPRLPFLSICLEKRYIAWEDKTGTLPQLCGHCLPLRSANTVPLLHGDCPPCVKGACSLFRGTEH